MPTRGRHGKVFEVAAKGLAAGILSGSGSSKDFSFDRLAIERNGCIVQFFQVVIFYELPLTQCPAETHVFINFYNKRKKKYFIKVRVQSLKPISHFVFPALIFVYVPASQLPEQCRD